MSRSVYLADPPSFDEKIRRIRKGLVVLKSREVIDLCLYRDNLERIAELERKKERVDGSR